MTTDISVEGGTGRWTEHRLTRAVLGSDQLADLAVVVATFVAFALLDRVTRTLAATDGNELHRFSLVAAAAGRRWWLVAAATVALAVPAIRWPGRVLVRWADLEEGRVLRLLSGALVALVVWQDAAYRYNWLAGRTHWLDRCLVLALGLATLARPAFALPLVAVARIVAEQFVAPFATTAGRNIDDLLLMALLAVAAAHLIHVVTGRRQTSPVLLVLAAAIASHFFIPGRGKLVIGWLGAGRIGDLPLSSYTAGWLGHTGGAWAVRLSGLYDRFRWPVMVATLALELGSVVAVARPRLLRWWLPGAIVFHVVTFATTGFWFVPWIVLEAGLLAILWAPSKRAWVVANATPGRSLVAVAAVLGAPVLFHPPGLAWLDSPVSYGYQMEATGVSGTRYQMAPADLAPLSHHVAFNRIQLGPLLPATGAYGANVSRADVDQQTTFTTFDQLTAYEATLGRPDLIEPSEAFLSTFARYAAQPHQGWLARANRLVAPPEHFWTSGGEPDYRFQEPVRRLEVNLVRSIHHDGKPETARQLVLVLTVGPDGTVAVEEPAG